MPFLKSFHIDTDRTHPFPFNIPGVMFAKEVLLDENVTIIVGENGSGKSTLLESIALKLNLPTINGYINPHEGYEAAQILKPFMQFTWNREVRGGFFFRAEDFSDFINAVKNEKVKLRDQMRELEGEVPKHIVDQILSSQSFHLQQIRRDYGDDMQAYSHGEAYMKILGLRMQKKGIYILDEPEAALSPMRQIALIASIMELCKTNNAQFIIATHSPILMGIPDASIYEISEDDMEGVDYQDTQHYRITKTFLDDPEYYLRHFR